jgi:SP family sugar:H+ symporter-like MFS transporter
MVWAVIGEMYPFRYRSQAMAIATSSNWIWNFLLAFFTPFITSAINYLYGYVFAGCNIVAAIIVYVFLMESAGRTIEEVDTMYLLHVNPMESSKWTSDMIEDELLNTDNLYLNKGGRGITKRNEGSDAGFQQDEGMLAEQHPVTGAHPDVVDSSQHPAVSSGAGTGVAQNETT